MTKKKLKYEKYPKYLTNDGSDNNQLGVPMPGSIEISIPSNKITNQFSPTIVEYNPNMDRTPYGKPISFNTSFSFMGKIPLCDRCLDPSCDKIAHKAAIRMRNKLSMF